MVCVCVLVFGVVLGMCAVEACTQNKKRNNNKYQLGIARCVEGLTLSVSL